MVGQSRHMYKRLNYDLQKYNMKLASNESSLKIVSNERVK